MITTENKTRTRNDIKLEWEICLFDTMKEVKEYDFKNESEIDLDDFKELVNERMWETIDGDEDVIYTNRAKEVSNIIDIYGAFNEWNLTGERFNNWSQVAFANIYDLVYNEIDLDEACERFLKI